MYILVYVCTFTGFSGNNNLIIGAAVRWTACHWPRCYHVDKWGGIWCWRIFYHGCTTDCTRSRMLQNISPCTWLWLQSRLTIIDFPHHHPVFSQKRSIMISFQTITMSHVLYLETLTLLYCYIEIENQVLKKVGKETDDGGKSVNDGTVDESPLTYPVNVWMSSRTSWISLGAFLTWRS